MSMGRIKLSTAGMRPIVGGEFLMGSNNFYAEESPVRRVRVESFLIDEAPVTNADFRSFVEATGHITVAETAPKIESYPGLLPELACPGSSVFVGVHDSSSEMHQLPWWRFVIGAHWRCPYGADSSIEGKDEHPVVHIAYEDALAYANWAGKSLPTEAEWEFAARGGIDGADYAWGDELAPGGCMMANYWQGNFPHENLLHDGWARTSPIGSFPANGYGLVDMIGNVWEWTSDWWMMPESHVTGMRSCCGKLFSSEIREEQSADEDDPLRIPRKVIKGGSHLCAPNYCQRYRPAARHPQPIDTGTSHIGFRCVLRIKNL